MAVSIPNVITASAMTDPEQPDPLALRIRQLRTQAGWSQEALAERTGLSQNAVSKLEKGPNPAPRLSTLRKLADALGLSVEELTSGSEGVSRPHPNELIVIPRKVLRGLLVAWLNVQSNVAEEEPLTIEDFDATAAVAAERRSAFVDADPDTVMRVLVGWVDAARRLRISGKPVTLDALFFEISEASSSAASSANERVQSMEEFLREGRVWRERKTTDATNPKNMSRHAGRQPTPKRSK